MFKKRRFLDLIRYFIVFEAHAIAFIGIDIGNSSFHVVGLDRSGAIVLRQKWSRGQVEAGFANIPSSGSIVELSHSWISSLARAGGLRLERKHAR